MRLTAELARVRAWLEARRDETGADPAAAPERAWLEYIESHPDTMITLSEWRELCTAYIP